jgi:hypothetical protein
MKLTTDDGDFKFGSDFEKWWTWKSSKVEVSSEEEIISYEGHAGR